MFQSPRILVCSDFSEGSDQALMAARIFAHSTKGEIHLLHVAELSFYLNLCMPVPALDQNFQENIRKDLIGILHDQAIRCGVVAEVNVQISSDFSHGVLKEMEILRPNVIFIGQGKHNRVEKYFFGDVSKKLASIVEIPLFIIRDHKSFERTAALVDGSSESELIIRTAEKISRIFETRLEVLSLLQQIPGLYSGNVREYSTAVAQAISSGTEQDLKKIKDQLLPLLSAKDTELLVAPSFERDLGHHLNEILADEGIGLIVLKRHHRSRVEKYFIGSVCSRLLELYDGSILLL